MPESSTLAPEPTLPEQVPTQLSQASKPTKKQRKPDFQNSSANHLPFSVKLVFSHLQIVGEFESYRGAYLNLPDLITIFSFLLILGGAPAHPRPPHLHGGAASPHSPP